MSTDGKEPDPVPSKLDAEKVNKEQETEAEEISTERLKKSGTKADFYNNEVFKGKDVDGGQVFGPA